MVTYWCVKCCNKTKWLKATTSDFFLINLWAGLCKPPRPPSLLTPTASWRVSKITLTSDINAVAAGLKTTLRSSNWRTHQDQYKRYSMVMIYCNEGMQIKVIQGKKHTKQSLGLPQAQNFLLWFLKCLIFPGTMSKNVSGALTTREAFLTSAPNMANLSL